MGYESDAVPEMPRPGMVSVSHPPWGMCTEEWRRMELYAREALAEEFRRLLEEDDDDS